MKYTFIFYNTFKTLTSKVLSFNVYKILTTALINQKFSFKTTVNESCSSPLQY